MFELTWAWPNFTFGQLFMWIGANILGTLSPSTLEQHDGIQTRSKAKIANVQMSTPEICRTESTPTLTTMDVTVEPLTENVTCDSSLLCQDDVVSDIDSDATSNSNDPSDGINEVDVVVSPRQDHNLVIPESPPPWWNRMVRDMNSEIKSMCATPNPD